MVWTVRAARVKKPEYRSPPTTNAGYLGPLFVIGCCTTKKGWGMILTCFTYCVVYVEMVPSMTSESYVMRIERFVLLFVFENMNSFHIRYAGKGQPVRPPNRSLFGNQAGYVNSVIGVDEVDQEQQTKSDKRICYNFAAWRESSLSDATKTVFENFCMDDNLDTVESSERPLNRSKKLVHLLHLVVFKLTKFVNNVPNLADPNYCSPQSTKIKIIVSFKEESSHVLRLKCDHIE